MIRGAITNMFTISVLERSGLILEGVSWKLLVSVDLISSIEADKKESKWWVGEIREEK